LYYLFIVYFGVGNLILRIAIGLIGQNGQIARVLVEVNSDPELEVVNALIKMWILIVMVLLKIMNTAFLIVSDL